MCKLIMPFHENNKCMHIIYQKNTNGDFLPESLIYLNRHMKFHFLVDWPALMSLYDASKRGTNKMLSECPQID